MSYLKQGLSVNVFIIKININKKKLIFLDQAKFKDRD